MAKLKVCKSCRTEIDGKAKKCPNCGSKQPNYLLYIIIAVFIVLVIALAASGNSNNEDDTTDDTSTNDVYDYEQKVEVIITDFSAMTKDQINAWCDENKVKCVIEYEFSDTVGNGKFISQSVDAGKTVYENSKVTLYYSKGKKPTQEQLNALAKAESYCEHLNMSKKGIYDQLISPYGEDFDKVSAQYAIDHLSCNYKENALEKAKSYRDNLHMSKNSVYDQLISQYGEQFTKEEAQYAINNLDD